MPLERERPVPGDVGVMRRTLDVRIKPSAAWVRSITRHVITHA